ncbi:adenosylcobinamide-GDP ribazoletransferase [Roseospira marina]|uniref:Adenosylcobinamide-GDP ribazoletransferase n=1 Tax=Roseospira marina TaxID=140057 RepID=A0A5M6IDB2_9PROT|nr:adenosylcobinamide-GDP ribazoletransferase [Roseospira marina]KAA5605749.1 adenosylcobinamide-GDP ribazoletransferase [Roseospira marina]MBB4313552.1 adenosylcobinamide-GDP ribazoletransferase [Roseospira marina]MBB5086714.1 adenosylcobinamide-GDP ribazoletransferase [Roseospira marina]
MATALPSWIGARVNEVHLAVVFLTRLPWFRADWSVSLMSAAWAFPLAGVLLGAVCGLVAGLAMEAGATPLLSAVLAVGAATLFTGCLHEDGVGDTADGIGSGRDRERSLEILRDSRIGTYGLVAIVMTLLIRVSALTMLLEAGSWWAGAMPAWMLAAALGRGTGPLFTRLCPPARADGVGAGAGRPGAVGTVVALLLPLVAGCLTAFGVTGGLMVPLALVAALAPLPWLARLARRRLGGYTGDVIGAAILIVECTALALLAVTWV